LEFGRISCSFLDLCRIKLNICAQLDDEFGIVLDFGLDDGYIGIRVWIFPNDTNSVPSSNAGWVCRARISTNLRAVSSVTRTFPGLIEAFLPRVTSLHAIIVPQ
jgi:hypothetical protein